MDGSESEPDLFLSTFSPSLPPLSLEVTFWDFDDVIDIDDEEDDMTNDEAELVFFSIFLGLGVTS